MPFDPADPRTWPVWMRAAEIVTSTKYRGPYPGTRWHWDEAVRQGRVPKPKRFSSRIVAWHRNVVARACGLPAPGEAKPTTTDQETPQM
jgi:hypothetical protein